ncbi:MAG: LicD family protein [Selenomonadaceae bacterium]|nr:LicD family protein [Selenomonadaceae bacterium]
MENPNQALIQQNNFLASQNKLLEQINGMLMRQNPALQSNEIFIENIDRDEMRNGFLVTSHRKKLWNVQIGLIKEFDRICKKHNLRWFAYGGTLLGAARHKGFIPWDDDVDVCMLRPEYEKFRQIAPDEVKYPYFLDIWYNYRLESDDKAGIKTDNSLQFISLEQEQQQPLYPPLLPFIKLRDSRTFYYETVQRKSGNMGIFIDIFPLDPLPPFEDDQQNMKFTIEKELLLATTHTDFVKKQLDEGKKFVLNPKELRKFMKLPYRQRGMYFDNFMAENFFPSKRIGGIKHHCLTGKFTTYPADSFRDIIYMPFETIQLPAPIGYDEYLKEPYGDWHKIVFSRGHCIEWSADIAYTEYYRTSAFMR